MSMTLAAILTNHLTARRWTFERLADETTLPRNTVYQWTRGKVRRVHRWQHLVRIASALDLDRAQTDALLVAGGHAPIDRLMEKPLSDDDRKLLARWVATTPHNLPADLTTFVGRHQEIGQITRLLAANRLVTLTGPGGSGKTRLALEVAHAVLSEFEEVAFVDLVAVRDPAQVIPAISHTLDLPETLNEPPPRTLARHLRHRRLLLVLDNVEQVIEAAPLLANLLASAREVTALVTSRMRLNVRGEHAVAVPPLPLPDRNATFDELARNPAVALFADRARAADPAFSLAPGNAHIVAEVCARLDGLPLGIELAAARIRRVGLCAMLQRFPGRLALASGGPRDVHHRQRTLRATIAWSHDLLTHEERTLFDALGVFSGGFTEEAAASVCEAIGRPDIDVAERLDSLVEQNLLRRSPDVENEPRYEMLDTIHEFSLEKLAEHGGVDAMSHAAAGYYLELAERADLQGRGQAHWLHRLAAEHANFREALAWCDDHGQPETGLRLTLALMPLWLLRDHQMEARTWLETFMASASALPPNLRASGLLWQGLLLLRGEHDHTAALPRFHQALALFRDVGDLDGMSDALQAEGDVYRHRGRFPEARERYAESLALAQRTGHHHLAAHGWMGLAFCAQEEEQYECAQHHWEMTLEYAKRAENGGTTALALNSLGEMARHRQDWDEASRRYEQALKLAERLDSDFRRALALHNLGYVALATGHPRRAGRLFTDSLALYAGRRYDKGVAECLAGLGAVEASAGSPERAARLCGAAASMLERLGTRLDTLDRADYERTLATLRERLGARIEPLLDANRAMSVEEAVQLTTPAA